MTRWGRRTEEVPALPPLVPLGAAEPAPPPPASPALVEDDAFREEERARPEERWRAIIATATVLAEHRREYEALTTGFAYPLEAYDQFRRDVPMRPPPSVPTGMLATFLIDARVAAPFLIRATLRSLQDQSVDDWSALVVAPPDIRAHPVASFADTDTRVRFVDSADVNVATPRGTVILLDAGTALVGEALAWVGFAMARTGGVAAFCDHDHGIADPALRIVRADPVLFGTFDMALMRGGEPPALVAVDAAHLVDDAPLGGPARLDVLEQAAAAGRVAAIPRLLATQLALPLVARGGRSEPRDGEPGRLAPAAALPPSPTSAPPSDDRIAVVIPTRDAAGLLARAVSTLRETARNADRLDIVVVDNGSREPETAALFARFQGEGTAQVVPFESPFNWSLASNRGAEASTAPLITFVNNDIEMLARGWDDILVAALRRPQVGAVGARLLYPGGTIQHAGMAFGFGPGGAEHEGRGISRVDPGPGRRYVTDHTVSSVTGAFLAVRRADFEAVGGFDAARLMIAHSDVDLCLKLRERGLEIFYCAGIEAIHHEGASRGINQSRTAVSWDEGERADLIARWGDSLFEDPGVSPYWQRGDQPFALLREPSMREVLAHLDRSATAFPWRPARAAGEPAS